MHVTFRSLTAGLIAVGGAALFGWSADTARAQSSCVEQCRSQGWAWSQCRRYCETRYGEPGREGRGYGYDPRAYGYAPGYAPPVGYAPPAYGSGPRVYGYMARGGDAYAAPMPVPMLIPVPVPVPVYVMYSSCGQFHYRRDGVCVDARIEAPRLD